MKNIFVTEPDCRLGFSQGRITVKLSTEEKSYPVETVGSISLFGRSGLSTAFIVGCLRHDIMLLFYTIDGHYHGRLQNPAFSSATKLRLQVHCSENEEFRLRLARAFVEGKIQNQIALLQSHDVEGILQESDYQGLKHSLENLHYAESVDALNGFEGNAASSYFSALSKIVPVDFRFAGRSKRPPKDPFNSLISFGYSLLYNNVLGAIERHKLSPFLGFMHADAENHASLASDLMEEWRAIIVDDTVLQLINARRINPTQFTANQDTGAIFMDKECMRTFVKAISDKMTGAAHYLSYEEFNCGFQYAVDRQLYRLERAMEALDPRLYIPVTAATMEGEASV